MASSKPPASGSAAAAEELSEVQVLDSGEPLVTVSSSVSVCSVLVTDSKEPPVPTTTPRVQVLDSNEPLVLATSCVQVIDSSDPLVHTTKVPVFTLPIDSVAGPSGMGIDQDVVMPPSPDADTEPRSGSSGRRVNYYSEEISAMWNWKKVFSRLGTEEQCIQFSVERNLIPTEKQCRYHRRPMLLSSESGQLGRFRCRKSNCRNKSISRALGTWFENVRLSLTLVFQIMYAFSEGLTYHQAQKELASENEPVLSSKTVADWYSYCRETVVIYELEHLESTGKIGGINKIVQIDESKFGRRKYNRGRHIEGHWVIGMIEDGNDDLRLEVCPDNDRSAEILVPLIKKHVQEGSIIHTDYWRAYLSLPEHGYIHKRVNHSDPTNKFVALDGTHTQRVESQWRGLKKAFRQEHNKGDFTDWLIEYSWRRKIRINHRDPFEELLKAVEYVYRIN